LTYGRGGGPGAGMSISSGLEQNAYAIVKWGTSILPLYELVERIPRMSFGDTHVQGFFVFR
jgi:hypothetical protein